jgi:hypothetical protein
MNEDEIWDRLEKRRQKAQLFLETIGSPRREILEPALQEICEIEMLLADLWTRLEMQARKPSSIQPIPHNRTLAQRWLNEVALPLAWAVELNEEGEETSKNSTPLQS